MTSHTKSNGFSIVELLIVMGIFAIFFAFASLNLLGIRNKTSIGTSVDVLLSDLKTQQIKAMSGDANYGADNDSFGIHFLTDSYILFKGSYTPGDSNNFIVKLDDAGIDTTFPSGEILFKKISGEVNNFVPTGNTIKFSSNNSTDQKIITVNRLGTVTGVN